MSGYSLANMEAGETSERRRTYPRGGEEFSRVLAFSDGLFAIAMTYPALIAFFPFPTDLLGE